jgi:fucose 4-O-acetylase-like acetyltransferase
VYFFTGLHFKTISAFFPRRRVLQLGGVALLVVIGALISDGRYLTDRSAVGANFEFNNLDYAYARPQLLLYDLAITGILSIGVALGWSWRPSLVSFLGQYTLEIYLWHILLLYEGAWRWAEVLESCRQMPELILIICGFACILLAGTKYTVTALTATIRQYRLVLVRSPW